MRITKYEKHDVAYIEIKRGKVFETKRVGNDVIVDLDKNGNAVGVELLTLGPTKGRKKKKSKK